jgi:hypothetical protein
MVRYCGYYTNVSKGERQKENTKRKSEWLHTLHPGIRGIIKRVTKELGKVDSKDPSLSRR